MSKDTTQECIFQDDMIAQMVVNGWVEGKPDGYNRESALYEQDVLKFVKQTQPKEWLKLCKLFPIDPQSHFLDSLVGQLKKADINAIDQLSRSYGTLGVLRHGLKIHNARFFRRG